MAVTRAIFGLGNPGEQYRDTRHNCGFRFVERIAQQQQEQLKSESRFQANLVRVRIDGATVWLVQPMTFMNRSGTAFNLVTRYYDIDPQDAIVVYDDLDLPVGNVRVRRSGGPGGHNGVSDIIAHGGTRDFLRIRFGIGRPNHRINTTSYVLSVPSAEDRHLIDDAIDDAIDALPEMLTGNLEKAMTSLHSRADNKVSEQNPAA